jgi:Sulfotransferase family
VTEAPTDPKGQPAPTAGDAQAPFFVPSFVDALGGLVQRHRNFWLWLGRLESSLLAEEIGPVHVRMPIYVCGLARSGSTLLHEVVASHPGVATHRIKDYPMLFTPYWWRRATANLRPQSPRERVHRDGVMITPESPDALEEMLWMAFFPRCHDPSQCGLLGAADRNPAFESFYKLHIRKLLLAEDARRYAAKANYHIARLPYLLRLFADARFLIPVRAPETHSASLVRAGATPPSTRLELHAAIRPF